MILLLPGVLAATTAVGLATCPLEAKVSSVLPGAPMAGPGPYSPAPPSPAAVDSRPDCGSRARSEDRLATARTLLVQFQRLDPAGVSRADPDVLITDYSWDGGGRRELTRWDVLRLRWRTSGPPRIVLAYVSVGEAEDYRYYWPLATRRGAANFLDRPNPRWPGNIRVRFWERAWHEVIYAGRDAWIDRILDAGFDGVFLDTVDAAESWAEEGRKDAPARMADLVKNLAEHARRRAPGFLVVASNPFVVLEQPGFVDALSGILAEGHLLRGDAPQPSAIRSAILEPLRRASAAGATVMLVEYPRTHPGRQRFASICSSEGFLCYAGVEALDRVGTLVPRAPFREEQR